MRRSTTLYVTTVLVLLFTTGTLLYVSGHQWGVLLLAASALASIMCMGWATPVIENPFDFSCLDGQELVCGELVAIRSAAHPYNGEFGYVAELAISRHRIPVVSVYLIGAAVTTRCYPFELMHSKWEA